VTAKVPFSTPADSGIYLLGNLPRLGGWVGAGAKMVRRPNGQYVLRFNAPAGKQLAFKVTRGAWTTEERGLGGDEMPERTLTVGSEAVTVDATVYTWRDQVSLPPTLTGDLRYHRGVTSAFLSQPRDLIIYLPPGYATDTSRRYPVLYMHDGQNLMDASTSGLSHAEWSVDEVAQRLIRYGVIEPLIIVGVYNTPDRIAEYTEAPNPPYGGGNADSYGRFLVEELKPMIDATYRTKPEAQSTGMAGSSLGGLVSAYFGLTRSGTFTRIAAVSPSVWWAKKDIVTRVNALPSKLPLRVWIDIGTQEGGTPQEEVDNARLLRDAYAAKGWALGSDLAYLEVPSAEHTESAWAARIDRILFFLYPAP
jgi:predicted alpha/beta superfamily hydrolase